MIKSLVTVRLRAMLAAMTAQARKKKKSGKGALILFGCLYAYVGIVLIGMMCAVFGVLAEPYHTMELDWLYFAMAGVMGLGFAVFGSVFSTQSQLYDAKDNDLLLSMPIPPKAILLSRMLPLLGMNLLFAGIVILPALAMYSILVAFSPVTWLLGILALLGVTLLAQAVACLLGWGLHLLLGKINKSVASLLYLVIFFGVYFSIYGNIQTILQDLAMSGEAISGALRTWVWPVYAMGVGCTGNALYLLIFMTIAIAVFALVYWILSRTFLKTATMKRTAKRRKLKLGEMKAGSASDAIVFKELRRFLGCPVYMTNMGIGILLLPALTVAGIFFRGELLESLGAGAAVLKPYFPLFICGIFAFMTSMNLITAPSVSLEGKYIWVLKSMPVSGKTILLSKLRFHCLMTTPLTAVCAAVLAFTYDCGVAGSLLCALVGGTLSVITGLFGLICGLQWARLDWISEAYPCKQSAAVAVPMFGMMGVPLLLGGLYALTAAVLTPTAFLAAAVVLLAAAGFGLYKALITWGVRKWNDLA